MGGVCVNPSESANRPPRKPGDPGVGAGSVESQALWQSHAGPGYAPVAALGEQARHRGGRLWLGTQAGGRGGECLVIWGVKMRSREVQGWEVEGPVAHGQVEEGLTVRGKSVLGPGPRGRRAP